MAGEGHKRRAVARQKAVRSTTRTVKANQQRRTEQCTCACTRCWYARAECKCSEGPEGPPSGSCRVHGEEVS